MLRLSSPVRCFSPHLLVPFDSSRMHAKPLQQVRACPKKHTIQSNFIQPHRLTTGPFDAKTQRSARRSHADCIAFPGKRARSGPGVRRASPQSSCQPTPSSPIQIGLPPEWRNWQTHWTQNPARLTPRVGSTPTSGTLLRSSLRSSYGGQAREHLVKPSRAWGGSPGVASRAQERGGETGRRDS